MPDAQGSGPVAKFSALDRTSRQHPPPVAMPGSAGQQSVPGPYGQGLERSSAEQSGALEQAQWTGMPQGALDRMSRQGRPATVYGSR